jgi:hypothetical protein
MMITERLQLMGDTTESILRSDGVGVRSGGLGMFGRLVRGTVLTRWSRA